MKLRVIVKLKDGVLDPQGMTIQRSLNKLGHREITSVRQGKYFEIEFRGAQNKQDRKDSIQKIAREILSNPIIETFEIEEI